jgi:hypothetical protein
LLIQQGRLAECTSLRFIQQAKEFEIAGYNFGCMDIGINHNRKVAQLFRLGAAFFMSYFISKVIKEGVPLKIL